MKNFWVTVNYRQGYSFEEMVFETDTNGFANWVLGVKDEIHIHMPKIHATKTAAADDALGRLAGLKEQIETLLFACHIVTDNMEAEYELPRSINRLGKTNR